MTPFDYVKSINNHTREKIEDREYSQFLINTAFSLFPDTVIQANQVNCLPGIDPQMHYDYLYSTIRPRKRFKKWPKKNIANLDSIQAIMHYYKYNRNKAMTALEILTDEQVDAINKKINWK
jgi:hypothetical protein